MRWLSTYLTSSLGKKQIMAVTGLLLSLFVLQHMISHLQVFRGADAYNSYAHSMQGLGPLLWIARSGLIFITLAHIVTAVSLVIHNRRARPVGYRRYRPARSRFYARVMMLTGTLLAVFVVLHILHFTTGDIFPGHYANYDREDRHDVYLNMVLSFSVWWMVVFYIAAMAFLCMHLAHGMSSWFQSLGLRHPKYVGFIRAVGPVYGVVTFLGYISVPLAILAGVIR